MIDFQKLVVPIGIVGAVAGVYALFRNTGNTVPGAVTPSPASSGVPVSYSTGGVVQPVNYNVPAVNLAPFTPDYLADPFDANSGGIVPAYITSNAPPSADIVKQAIADAVASKTPAASSGGCGCGCDTCPTGNNNFTDSQGTQVAASAKQQAASPVFINNTDLAAENAFFYQQYMNSNGKAA